MKRAGIDISLNMVVIIIFVVLFIIFFGIRFKETISRILNI